RCVPGPAKEGTVRVNQIVVAIDQNAGRQAVEDRTILQRVAGWSRCWRRSLYRGCNGRGFRWNRCARGFARRLAQAGAELARAVLKGAVFFGTERRPHRCGRRRRKGQHFGRLARRDRILRELSALQVSEPVHVAAQAEATKSPKTTLAVEHWQA